MLANDSKLYAFGDNSFYGALGIGSTTTVSTIAAVDSAQSIFSGTTAANTVDSFDTGSQFSAVLLNSGNIATWGRNDYGQLV
jgi:alpha-tubulin suppressor-like RCC1 family protein